MELTIAWAAALVLLLASLASGGKRRRAVTILVMVIALGMAYALGSWNPPSLARALPFDVCFHLALPFAACFAIAFASLETKNFPWLALASAAVSVLFLVYGTPVHSRGSLPSFLDGTPIQAVCAGFVIALFSRYIAEWIVRNAERKLPGRFFYSVYKKPEAAKREEETEFFEYRRKGFHFLGGMLIIAMIYFLGNEVSLLLFCAAALASLFVINSIAQTGRSAFEQLIRMFERHGKRPLDGVLWFLAGTSVLLLFASQSFVLSGVFVMAAGDAGAAIFGKKFGSVKWPYNKKKSVVGSLAFVVCSLPALLLSTSPITSAAILVCAAMESLNWEVDDNIMAAIVFTVASNV